MCYLYEKYRDITKYAHNKHDKKPVFLKEKYGKHKKTNTPYILIKIVYPTLLFPEFEITIDVVQHFLTE